MKRWPKGYASTNHETIGSDICSILKVVSMPRQILGAGLTDQLEGVRPDGWYPIGILLEEMDLLAERIGYAGLLQMGRALFKLSHEERVKQTARSAGDIIFGLDGMYHHANRGDAIGGWQVLEFSPGGAKLDKTTPHHCWMEEGILSEALRAVGVPAFVSQSECFRQGAPSCVYSVTSVVRDQLWTGMHALVGA